MILAAFADAAVDPIDFPIAPAHAVPKVGIKLFCKTTNFPRTGFLVHPSADLPVIRMKIAITS